MQNDSPTQKLSQNRPVDNSTPINRNSNIKPEESYVNKFIFDDAERPYYINGNFQQPSHSSQKQETKVSSGEAIDQASSSPETLKQQQATNPYFIRMQKLRERQQKQLEAQLKNQDEFNPNNVVIDSDV